MTGHKGYHNRPSRQAVYSIAQAVALEHVINPADIYIGRGIGMYAARKDAWWRIMSETGCSMSGLAHVWGIDRQAIWRAFNLLPPEERAAILASLRPKPLKVATPRVPAVDLGPDPKPPGGLPAILRETALDHDLAPDDLKLQCRLRKFAHPRQDFMWRARQLRWANGEHRYSAPMIASFLGMKNHTSVLYGVAAHLARAGGRKMDRKHGLRPRSLALGIAA
jgi:hypothetical protein